MRTLLRALVYSSLSLFIAASSISTFRINGGLDGFLFTALVFSLLNLIVRPLLHLILLPLSLITFGIVSWVVNVLILYLLVRLSHHITISAWKFPGLSYHQFALSSFAFNDWQTFIVIGVFIGIIINLLYWLSK